MTRYPGLHSRSAVYLRRALPAPCLKNQPGKLTSEQHLDLGTTHVVRPRTSTQIVAAWRSVRTPNSSFCSTSRRQALVLQRVNEPSKPITGSHVPRTCCSRLTTDYGPYLPISRSLLHRAG